MRDAGICFGFAVRSDLQMSLTRAGGSVVAVPLEVSAGPTGPVATDQPVIRWQRSGGAALDVAVFRSADRVDWRVHVEGGGWFDVRPGRITVPEDHESVRREERLWGLPALLAFRGRGDLAVHASAVEVGGRAVLLAGPTRAGKTTLATAAAARGRRVLSEDLCCVRLGSTPLLLPGPASLRVRHDMTSLLQNQPEAGIRDLQDDRLHVALGRAAAGSGDPLPVAAVMLLREGDGPLVVRRDGALALRELWTVTQRMPETQDRSATFHQLGRLVDAVPVLDLVRPLRLDSLTATLDLLDEVVGG